MLHNRQYLDENPIKLRQGKKVDEKHYNDVNAFTHMNGVYYEIDEKATKKYYEDLKKQAQAREDKARLEKEKNSGLVEALIEKIAEAPKKAVKTEDK